MVKAVTSFGGSVESARGGSSMNPVFGIDLGTTNSAISVVAAGSSSETIRLRNGKFTMPSCVMYDHGKVVVGEKAYANRYQENTVYSVKRFMQEPQAMVSIRDGNEKFKVSPAEVSAEILKGLVEQAGTMYGRIQDVVVTVPAYFDQNGINATRKACEMAGLNLIRIANEPTAASLCYHLEPEANGQKDVVVYDLGGGTFDVTLMRIVDNSGAGISSIYGLDDGPEKEVCHSVITLGISGDTHLGGDDIDDELLNVVKKKLLAIGIDSDKLTHKYLENMKLRLEQCKKSGVDSSYVFPVETIDRDGREVSTQVIINSDDFKCAAMLIFEKTRKILNELLRSVENDAATIVLTGGSTKHPFIREAIRLAYPSFEIDDALSPDLSVSQGAAIQGKVTRFGDINTQIFDILPIGIGVLENDRVATFISGGTSLPVVKTLPFTTYKDNQTKISVRVYQGSSSFKEECVPLGELMIDGIAPKPAGEADIRVTVAISADRKLTCKAVLDGASRELSLDLSGETGAASSGKQSDEKLKRRLKRAAKYVTGESREKLLGMVDGLGVSYTLEEINAFIEQNREKRIV